MARIYYTEREISSAEILSIYDTPVTVVPAESGIAYGLFQVVLEMYNVTTPYSGSFSIASAGADSYMILFAKVLPIPSDRFVCYNVVQIASQVDETQYLRNADMQIRGFSSNPLFGDGDLRVYIWYSKF